MSGSKLSIVLVLIPIIITSIIANTKNIKTQVNYNAYYDHDIPSASQYQPPDEFVLDNDDSKVHRSISSISTTRSSTSRECFKARKDTVPPSLYHKLPKPYINLGFPKMGTSSLDSYFKCGNLTSNHFRCGKSSKCSSCMKESVQAGLPPLALCGEADMYAQIDDALYFPQIELLDEIVHGYPNATFFLTFRSMEKWYHSITHWPPRKHGPYMRDRMIKFNITGSPTCGDGIEYNYRDCNGKDIPAIEEFSDWYCKHVQRVRDVVARNPSHTLVEVDIEDPEIGQRMEDIFGIGKSCWGHVNANANIHPELNQSEVTISKFQQKQQRKEKMLNNNADDQGEDDDEQEDTNDNSDEDEEEDGTLEAFNEADDDYATSEDVEDSKNDDDSSFFNQNCFKARKDTVSPSLYNNLPKPYINLGFPKMGTSSLHSFFKCGNLTSTHYSCGKKSEKCSLCTKHSVEAGLPPLSQCGKADMYAQLDNGQYFPQIELLEEFIHGYSNATFFLTFRSMEKWYQSLRNWPPRQRGPHMNNRFRKLNITGLPAGVGKNVRELSDWYCKHVERVRGLVARHPSHTLVEVDIEDPEIGQRMEDMFGIEKSCWGHKNANAIMMTENMTQLDMVEMHKHYKEGETAQMKAQKEEENRIKKIKHLESLSPRRIKRRMKNGRWPEELAASKVES